MASKPFDPARSKKNGYQVAMTHFDAFLSTESIKNFSGDRISPNLFEKFSSYLRKLKRQRKNADTNENYSLGRVHQYISGVFNVLKQNHPQLSIWQHDLVPTGTRGEFVPRWYRTVR